MCISEPSRRQQNRDRMGFLAPQHSIPYLGGPREHPSPAAWPYPFSGSSALLRQKLAYTCMGSYIPGSPSALFHPSQGYYAPTLAAFHASVLAVYSPMVARGWHWPASVLYSSWLLGLRHRKYPSTFSQSAVPQTATINSHSFTSAKEEASVGSRSPASAWTAYAWSAA